MFRVEFTAERFKGLVEESVQQNHPLAKVITPVSISCEPQELAAVSEKLELLRLFVAQTPKAVAMLDRQMRYLLVSQRWEIDHGLERQNIIGRSHFEIFPHTSSRWQAIFERCLTGEAWKCKHKLSQQNLGKFVQWEIHPWRSSNGEIGGAILFAEIISDRHDTQTQLHRSPRPVKVQPETTIDGMLVVNKLGRVVSYNSRFAELWQIPEDVLEIGDDTVLLSYVMSSLKHPQEFFAQVEYLYAYPMETSRDEIEFRDGRVLERYTAPAIAPEGNTYGRIWYFRDITEFKQIEKRVRRYEKGLEDLITERTIELARVNERLQDEIREKIGTQAELDRIFRLSVDILAIASTNGYFNHVNPAVQKILGYTPEEFLAIPYMELIHPDDRAATQAEVIKQISEGATTVKFQNRYRCKDGSYRWLSWNSVPLAAEGLMYGVARDITDNKIAEEALRLCEAREREKAEQLEKTLHELKSTQSQLIHSEKLSTLGQMVAGIAHEINNPVNFIYGNIGHIREYSQDLLTLLQLYLKEYPSPAPSIREAMEEIDLEFLMDDLPKLLDSMKVGADRIREIVLSLRNFSRLGEVEMKPTDLHQGIESTLMILQNRLKAKAGHPEIKVTKHFGELPMIDCYPGQLNQVFMNILANAIDALDEYNEGRSKEEIKANPSVIKIQTEVRCEEGFTDVKIDDLTLSDRKSEMFYAVISISDNGPGIAPEICKSLFDPFFTTKPVGKGTGLGLAISYQIVVEKHRGRLWCNSQRGEGAKFIIEIPIKLNS